MLKAAKRLRFEFGIAIMGALIVVAVIAALRHTIPQGLFADRDPEIAASFEKIAAKAQRIK